MATPAEIDEVVRQMAAQAAPGLEGPIRTALEAGIKIGEGRSSAALAEIQRIASAIAPAAEPPKVESPALPTPRANGGYSGVAAATRSALAHVGRVQSGIDISKMLEHIHLTPGQRHITRPQVRSAVMQLIESGEAVRTERGMYRAGPKLVIPINLRGAA